MMTKLMNDNKNILNLEYQLPRFLFSISYLNIIYKIINHKKIKNIELRCIKNKSSY